MAEGAMAGTPNDLIQLARSVVARMVRSEGRGSAFSQLVLSELYEALRTEADAIDGSELANRARLQAAIECCRRAADPRLSAALRCAEVKGTLALLESENAIHMAVGAPRFRVIHGGLSNSAIG